MGIEFKKFDTGKPRWSLLPWDVLLGVVHILGFGADKYGPDNWMNGAEWSRYYNSTMRHITAWWMGESVDPETGRSHLLHAICGLIFLAAYEMRGIGRDDRPVGTVDKPGEGEEVGPLVELETTPAVAQPSYSPSEEEVRWAVAEKQRKRMAWADYCERAEAAE